MVHGMFLSVTFCVMPILYKMLRLKRDFVTIFRTPKTQRKTGGEVKKCETIKPPMESVDSVKQQLL